MKTIKINDLKKLFEMVIEQLHTLEGIEEIEVDKDMYRFIPTDKWQSFSQEPLTGSLYDDVEELQKVLNEADKVISYNDFDRVANLLHFISEKLNPVSGIPFEEEES